MKHMEWSTRRKLLYGVSTAIFTLAITGFIVTKFLLPSPSCFDGKKNAFEVGIDCGGTCALQCSSQTIPLQVLWARALPVGTSTYDIVGLIANKNINNAPKAVMYMFTVYNKEGQTIFVNQGTTTISVDDDMPIIIQSVPLADIPSQTVLALAPAKHYATSEKSPISPIRTVRTKIEDGTPARLYVTIQNTKQITFADLPVRVILYDDQDNAIAAGKTVVPFLNKEEQKDLVYLWDNQFPSSVARIRVYYEFPQ